MAGKHTWVGHQRQWLVQVDRTPHRHVDPFVAAGSPVFRAGLFISALCIAAVALFGTVQPEPAQLVATTTQMSCGGQ